MTPLVSRVVVAAVGLPAVLALVYVGGWWLFALAAIAAVLALHEYALMTRALRPVTLAAYAGALLSLLGAELGGPQWTVAGLCLGYLILLRDIPDKGRLATFAVLLAVWAGDIGAFFAGRLIGRHKLAPRLSPGKTWEGFVFGTLATVFVTFDALYKRHYISIGESLLLGLVIAVAGPLGDLFESGVKRDMQVKDSGRLLGGHGGVLDRLDAPLFAFVAAYYLLRVLDAA